MTAWWGANKGAIRAHNKEGLKMNARRRRWWGWWYHTERSQSLDEAIFFHRVEIKWPRWDVALLSYIYKNLFRLGIQTHGWRPYLKKIKIDITLRYYTGTCRDLLSSGNFWNFRDISLFRDPVPCNFARAKTVSCGVTRSCAASDAHWSKIADQTARKESFLTLIGRIRNVVDRF